jgi:hypothetical protein
VRSLLAAVAVAMAAAMFPCAPAFAANAGSDPWAAAAADLSMPVLEPASTPGMTVRGVDPQHVDCGAIKEQLIARYSGGPNGKRLKVFEGKPQYCGDIGDAPVIARLRIHGRRATLYDYCEGLGCRQATNAFLLTWRERGIGIVLISRGTSRSALAAIGESMALVPG